MGRSLDLRRFKKVKYLDGKDRCALRCEIVRCEQAINKSRNRISIIERIFYKANSSRGDS